MALNPGTRLGVFEVVSLLGAGGMGEVYKARDTRLDRLVAIKVLSDALSADPQFRDRFEREARAISNLDHAHICTLYDVGQHGGTSYLVLQLLEGETLQARLAKGALPMEQALQYAIQIASALDKAHRAGIIHRDLKPGNIMLTKNGAVLLDFGLAKAAPPLGAAASLSMLPTTPANATVQGTIVGTFQYMAPEQLEGLDADARTDMFAFGAVLYEMLTGKHAFEGKTRASLMGAILKDEPPPVSRVQPLAPASLDRFVASCLAKEPDDRWQSALDAKRELKWIAEHPTSAQEATSVPRLGRIAKPVSYALGGALLTVVLGWTSVRWTPTPTSQIVRFEIVPPPALPLAPTTIDRKLVISPDGTRVIYLSGNPSLGNTVATQQLTVRAMDHVDAEVLRGTAGARYPFVSPDGKWIGFFQGAELKKISITGGPAVTVCRIAGAANGATWGPDNTIVFSDRSIGLLSVSAGGGVARIVSKQDSAELHLLPSFLPDGHAVLFTLGTPRAAETQVAALDLKTGQKKTLIQRGSDAVYIAPGYLIYVTAGTLSAVRFDPVHLDVLSDPVPVVEQVAMSRNGTAQFSVSRSGALIYVRGGVLGQAVATRTLAWVTRDGHAQPIPAPPRGYGVLRLSPDGTRIALDIRDQEDDIWIWDVARQTLDRRTFDPNQDQFPVWTPDGKRIAFSSTRSGSGAGLQNLYWMAADGTGDVERLRTSAVVESPSAFSPDGTYLVIRENRGASDEVSAVTMAGAHDIVPLVHTAFIDRNGDVSADGRWLAYESNESGQSQIYVRPFPNVNAGRWQVSTAGGTRPVWARSGRELFYLDAGGFLTAVAVQTGTAFRAGTPTRLFDTRPANTQVNNGRAYDVSPDGQRFVMIRDDASSEHNVNAPERVTVVLNWLDELKQRVPTK